MHLANEIFEAWDQKLKGYLTVQQITEDFISLGLAKDSLFVRHLIHMLKPRGDENEITDKDFVKFFQPDRVGDKLCSLITSEFQDI